MEQTLNTQEQKNVFNHTVYFLHCP